MSLLDLIFPFKVPATGYVADSEEWLQGLPKHELFAGGSGIEPDWESLAPAFRSQESTMMCTAFSACNAVSMINKKETGESVVFSPMELFTRAFGSTVGNTIQNTANALGRGLVREVNCPWIGPVPSWDPYLLRLMGEYTKAKASQPDDSFAIRALTSVMPDRASMREALKSSPLIATLNVGRGYFDTQAPYVPSGSAHAIVITRVMDDGQIRVFDSITQTQNFNGFHWLSPQFQILYAFGILDLPNDWNKKQYETEQKKYGNVLSRYGMVQDFGREGWVSNSLQEARKKNPTHASYLDAMWTVYIMAITYGNYSIQDILNYISCLRRNIAVPFDLDKKKV